MRSGFSAPVVGLHIRGIPLLSILLALIIGSSVYSVEPTKDEPTKEKPSFFFSIEGAKDCAYDHVRERLYVTTAKEFVIVDTKMRKVQESVELNGTLQGCDISSDCKFLAVAPIKAQCVYRVGLKWDKIEEMEISQVKFKVDSLETGVFGVCVGSDNSVLFSTSFAGSGGVKLRRLTPDDKIEEVGRVNMNSVLTASAGDRRYAAVAQGNISSGPLGAYDFQEKQFAPITDLQAFHFEIACSRGAKYFARPHHKGCDLYDAKGILLGNLEGKPVICAAFHPKNDSLFVMRHDEINIEEYDIQGRKVAGSYPLDKPFVIKGDIVVQDVVNLTPVGRDTVIANFRRTVSVNHRTYQSGRLKVSEDGNSLFAVIPSGVYMFPVKPRNPTDDTKPKPKIKVIDP